MSIRKFRQMIYTNHFDKDYLLLEQKKKETETRIQQLLRMNEFEDAKVLMGSLEEIIKKMSFWLGHYNNKINPLGAQASKAWWDKSTR